MCLVGGGHRLCGNPGPEALATLAQPPRPGARPVPALTQRTVDKEFALSSSEQSPGGQLARGVSGGLSGRRARDRLVPPPVGPASPFPRPRPIDTVSWGMQVAAAWGLRFLIVVATVLVLVWLLNTISLVTITVVVAVMLSALLVPMVDRLARTRLPRPLAATAVFVLAAVVIVVSLWFVIAQVSTNAAELGAQLKDAGAAIRHWLSAGPLHLSETQVNNIYGEVAGAINRNRNALITGAITQANSALGVVGGAVFCLFALLFMLFDNGSMWRWAVSMFPQAAQAKVAVGGIVAWRTLVAYMRSTVLLALINALTMVVVMLVAGLQLVAPLGVLLFLGSLIPLIGMVVAGIVVVLVALVTKGAAVAIVMGVALVLTVQLEGNLLNPFILGKAVQIHPLVILVGVTGGAILGGVFGAFVAVPLIALINNVVRTVRGRPVSEKLLPQVEEAAGG
ncbi:MAG TPA: AI-2E family transporter [Dermatophilaceae bacterium]|nr:AI-2E family transporter [Dermatophilaceae bacterium]